MKNNHGITLTTLVVYIVGLLIVIGIVATITGFIRNNILIVEDSANSAAEFNKFNLAFIEEVKKSGNDIVDIQENYVLFDSGNKYLFQDGKIYKNKIEIVSNVKYCQFKLEQYEYKKIVIVYMELGRKNSFTETMNYVLAYD